MSRRETKDEEHARHLRDRIANSKEMARMGLIPASVAPRLQRKLDLLENDVQESK